MAAAKLNFDDIRIIICVQGYSLDYKFYPREIGFWYDGKSGSIPINCKINKSQLDFKNQKTIFTLEEEIHGIRLKKYSEYGLASSEFKAVLRTLYHVASQPNKHYIGICRDDNINGLLYQAGLGNFVYDLDGLDIMLNSGEKCPSNKDLQLVMKQDPNRYEICGQHDKLRIDEMPLCAKVKAEFIANFCNYLKNNTEKNNE